MDVRGRGVSRRDIRQGAGGGADEHFDSMIGSTEFNMFRRGNSNISGLESLQLFLESQGCELLFLTDTPSPVGPGYETIRITNKDQEIPVPVLRRAHSWAHRRNLLHLFRKPGISPHLRSMGGT